MSKKSALLNLVCAQRSQMRIILALLAAMGVFLALAAPFLEPGDESYPILVIDAVLLVATFVFFAATFRYCTRRAMDD